MLERHENHPLARLGILQRDAAREAWFPVRHVPFRPAPGKRLIVEPKQIVETVAAQGRYLKADRAALQSAIVANGARHRYPILALNLHRALTPISTELDSSRTPAENAPPAFASRGFMSEPRPRRETKTHGGPDE